MARAYQRWNLGKWQMAIGAVAPMAICLEYLALLDGLFGATRQGCPNDDHQSKGDQ